MSDGKSVTTNVENNTANDGQLRNVAGSELGTKPLQAVQPEAKPADQPSKAGQQIQEKDSENGQAQKQACVAYFCAEYGLQADLPLHAGGLGILAGDTVKEASDQNFLMVAVGLLYRGGNYVQKINEDGMQTEEDMVIDPVSSGFEHVYYSDEQNQPVFIKVTLTEQPVWARVWKRTVNKTTVYLLDTDTDQNRPEERGIAKAIYYGSEEVMLKQQLLLGIGGVKLLAALKIYPKIYHINEGRPAFLYWQLVRQFMNEEKLSFDEAAKKAKSMIVYTNHTLVRAGNQIYKADILKASAYYYAEKMGVTIDKLLEPGVDKASGAFSMSEFALKVSKKASAVSQAHFELSKSIWPEYEWVGITNGIHLPTWQDGEIAKCDKAGNDLWQVHMKKKKELSEFVKARTGIGYDPNWLVLGWARRMATYKRPGALFEDLARFKKIVTNQQRPVLLLMSGKAHPKDTVAKKVLANIIGMMSKDLTGHALFVPNYNIDVAQMMVKGVDVWINTPIQGQEASGTSGMKAIANGVLQLTVKDGWTAEVDWHDIGWTLDNNKLSDSFYFRLEDDVLPMFNHRDENDVPQEWLVKMKQSVDLASKFSTTRMLNEYQQKLYEC